MNDFLPLLRFDATRKNAEKQGENALLHFLHLLRSSAIKGENADSRAWCKNGINAINPSSLSSFSVPLASASPLGAANAHSLAATHSIRYSAEFLYFLRPAGTAGELSRRSFGCPDFWCRWSQTMLVTCEQCQMSFLPKHPRCTRFCSRRCANARGLAKPVRGILERNCRQCGNAFKPHYRGQPGLFCSRTCAGLGKTKPVPMRNCLQCGESFQKPGTQRFCSSLCANRWTGLQRIRPTEGLPAWKQKHREFSRDYKLVQHAIARGELSLPDDWHVTHPEVQAWILCRRSEIDGERELARQYAARSGWPTDIGPRCIQILNLLAHLGLPVGVREVSRVLGIGISSVRKQLLDLIREGWVIGLGPSRSQRFTLGPSALSLQQELAQCQSCKLVE